MIKTTVIFLIAFVFGVFVAVEQENNSKFNAVLHAINIGYSSDREIFLDNEEIKDPYKIKVNSVKIINESKNEMNIEVVYSYQNDIPAEEIKISVRPNHGYWAASDIKAKSGKNVARFHVGLSRSNMEQKGVTESDTDLLTVYFEHYPPTHIYGGVIWSEPVKYKKHWKLL